ncbi:hypothetical protein AX15_000490 [Amanita polypyramis BW_CC]|nr:hypothetical protein AX15_000490 [Amanita polypyramis BW_CC]
MQTPQSVVVFEDYLFYASLRRQEEKIDKDVSAAVGGSEIGVHEKNQELSQVIGASAAVKEPPPLTPDELERVNASRALRLSSWISVFFLLTTDIFGPFGVPYSIAQVGWVPGVLLFVICPVYSFFCSSLIHRLISSGHRGNVLWVVAVEIVPQA